MAAVQAQLAVQSKRKEKARIAARARRSQEASIIMEMATELEISQEKLRRIDKATIVKLAIDYISAHDKLCNPDSQFNPNEHLEVASESCKRPTTSVPKTTSQPARDPPLPLATRLNAHLQVAERIRSENNDDEDDYSELDEFSSGEHAKENSKKGGKHYQDSDSEEGERLEDAHKLKHQHIELERELDHCHQYQPQQQQLNAKLERPPLYSMPKLTTASIFAPKTQDNANSYFLMIEAKDNGKAAFVLKPDTEIQDEDDLTHLAPQAGDISISFETDPLDGIPIDDLLKT